MNQWIEVNGAKIERSFFDENVVEAQSYEWAKSDLPLSGHVHCMICGLALPDSVKREKTAYKSVGGWVDDYCYQNFVHRR